MSTASARTGSEAVRHNIALSIWTSLYTKMVSNTNCILKKATIKADSRKNLCEYKQSGTLQRWKPDLEVFTDIKIPLEFFHYDFKKQAVVNAGLKFKLYDEESNQKYEFLYENGITDYVKEISGEKEITGIQYCESAAKGRDRADKPEYKLKNAICILL